LSKRAFLNSTAPIDGASLPDGYVDDAPADGPYPDMFSQRWHN
jgi:hypothetical protein